MTTTNHTPTPTEDLRWTGFYIAAKKRWFRALDLGDAVHDYISWIDEKDIGARAIGACFPLYKMNGSGTEKVQIGTVAYNGRVTL